MGRRFVGREIKDKLSNMVSQGVMEAVFEAGVPVGTRASRADGPLAWIPVMRGPIAELARAHAEHDLEIIKAHEWGLECIRDRWAEGVDVAAATDAVVERFHEISRSRGWRLHWQPMTATVWADAKWWAGFTGGYDDENDLLATFDEFGSVREQAFEEIAADVYGKEGMTGTMSKLVGILWEEQGRFDAEDGKEPRSFGPGTSLIEGEDEADRAEAAEAYRRGYALGAGRAWNARAENTASPENVAASIAPRDPGVIAEQEGGRAEA